jgi:adenylate cyclase
VNVLIVDDEEPIRMLLSAVLSMGGYTTFQAADADSAMAIVKSAHISAFILDFQIGAKSGIELCRAIRAIPEHKITPVLMLTGSFGKNTLVDAFAAGCDDFITKPVERLDLIARLKSHLQRVAYFQELERTRRTLNRYISSRTREIAETSTRAGAAPHPELREVVILFTDIRGFTALAEEMDLDDLFHHLSAQLAAQVNLVYEYGGYIDKFGGDGVMAVFDKNNKAADACRCAVRMIETAEAGSALGIGIHLGQAMIGNIGSPQHMDYSVIGTTVNLAARLCGYAQPLSIVVSSALRDAVHREHPELLFEARRDVAVRGLKEAVTVYNLAGSITPPGDVSPASSESPAPDS